MIIRQAVPEDAHQIAPLVIQAMEDMVLRFTKSKDLKEGFKLFELFIRQPGTQYSYENTLVADDQGEICGSVTGYDGSKLNQLREPFLKYIQKEYKFDGIVENETETGEFYIDTISVSSHHQRKGIGEKLIRAMIERGEKLGFLKIGLLVDVQNPNAKKLYLKLGFKAEGLKNLLDGKYEHLVYTNSNI